MTESIKGLLQGTADQIEESKRLCIASRRSRAESAEVIRISQELIAQSMALLGWAGRESSEP